MNKFFWMIAISGTALAYDYDGIDMPAQQPADQIANQPAGNATPPVVSDPTPVAPKVAIPDTDHVVRTRLADGSYFESQRCSSRTRQPSDNVTVTTIEIVEKDRQGRDRASRQQVETVTKTADGEQRQSVFYRRTGDGKLTIEREVTGVATKNPDGTVTIARIEKRVDANGRLVTTQERNETVTQVGPTEKQITAKIMGRDHLEGKFGVLAEENTTVRTTGENTTTDRAVRSRTSTGWTVTERTSITETKAADGSVQRETVEQGRSLYSKSTGDDMGEPLLPKRKIVEREVPQADGTIAVQRDEFRRDVNGDWKPVSFSANTGQDATGVR